jgi:hypothetical protein
MKDRIRQREGRDEKEEREKVADWGVFSVLYYYHLYDLPGLGETLAKLLYMEEL